MCRSSEIGGICCTGQWSGTVAVDEAGGHLHNAIIWMDARGAPYVSKITGGLVAIDGYGLDKVWAWVRRTGGIPTHSGKDSIAHILFLRDRHRDIYDRTHKFLEPKDYINLRLTGSFATSVDSITLHWVTDNRDLLNVDYDDRLLKLATLDRRKLPDIRQSTEVLGPILPQVAAGIGAWRPCTDRDGIAGLAGHSRRLGRGGRLRAAPLYRHIVLAELPPALQKDRPRPQHGGAAVGLAGQVFSGQRARTGRGLSDLSAPQPSFFPTTNWATVLWRKTCFRCWIAWSIRRRRAAMDCSSRPGCNGERTPVDDSTLRGGFHNMSLQTTRADMIRVGLRGRRLQHALVADLC